MILQQIAATVAVYMGGMHLQHRKPQPLWTLSRAKAVRIDAVRGTKNPAIRAWGTETVR